MPSVIHTKRRILAVGIILTLLTVALSIWRPPLLQALDNRIYDSLAIGLSQPEGGEGPVVVELDEASLREFGQWPWPRGLLALLLHKIGEAGPRAVGVDILFAEPDRDCGPFAPGIEKELLRILGRPPLPPLTNDQILEQVLRQGPFVLGFTFHFPPSEAPLENSEYLHPLSVSRLSTTERPGRSPELYQASSATTALPDLAGAVTRTGFLNAVPDRDGVLRRAPLVIEYQNGLYPGLALGTLLKSAGEKTVLLKEGPLGLESLRAGNRIIPLDPRGNLLIHFPAALPLLSRISAADILHDRVLAGKMNGRIVMVGTTAAGLERSLTTPLNANTPGVELHSAVLANLLNGAFLARPAYMPGVEVLCLIAIGLLVPLLLARIPPLLGLGLTLALALGLWLASGWLLESGGLYYSPLTGLILLGATFPAATLVRFRAEEKKALRHSRQASQMQNFTMQSLASLAKIRDTETGEHILRTQSYLKVLCENLCRHPKFQPLLSPDDIELLYQLAPLHDIGKVGVPDSLLQKPGTLSPEEFEEIKKHTLYGREAILNAEQRVSTDIARTLQLAKDIVYYHHEWWNGQGYPEGLKGEQIPLAGRLMAVVDVYDALVSKRIYKAPISHEEAMRIILGSSGVQFDPEIVKAVGNCENVWKQITAELAENAAQPCGTTLGPKGSK